MTTRYNTATWNERQRWFDSDKWTGGSIYCSPIKMKESIGGDHTMIVLEMHNDENQIKAIGLVKNRPMSADRLHRIYQDRNYTRYIYKSPYRLVLADLQLSPREKKIIGILNHLLFKGARHCKRSHGITELPAWIRANTKIDFLGFFREILVRHYKPPHQAQQPSPPPPPPPPI